MRLFVAGRTSVFQDVTDLERTTVTRQSLIISVLLYFDVSVEISSLKNLYRLQIDHVLLD